MLLKSGPSSVCSLVSIDQQRVVSTSVSFLRLGLFIALACLFSTASSSAATFVVTNTNDSGPGSLRQAIVTSNSNGEIDTITFDPGVFSTPQTLVLTSGELFITGDVHPPTGNVVNLTIAGPGPNLLTIDGNNQSRIFHGDTNGFLLDISGLTLKHGFATEGGAISSGDGLIVSNMVITENTAAGAQLTSRGFLAGRGGGIFSYGFTIRDSVITNNVATGIVYLSNDILTTSAGAGGGIYTNEAQVVNCFFTGNSAIGADSGNNVGLGSGGGGAYGGAIYSMGLQVTNSSFSNNLAHAGNATINQNGGEAVGGAIFSTGGRFLNSSFINNAATGGNGGVNVDRPDFSGKGGPASGGGIFDDDISMANLTFVGNSVLGGSGYVGGDAKGGALFVGFGQWQVMNSTITDNTSTAGSGTNGNGVSAGGGVFSRYDNFLTVVFTNNIVANNAAAVGQDASGNFPGATNNLIRIGDNSSNITTGVNGNLVGTAAAPIEPMLGPLADNGGVTQTRLLLPGSPAIDSGKNSVFNPISSFITNPSPLQLDQRNYPRIFPSGGGIIDMGAVEFGSVSTPVAPFAPDLEAGSDTGASNSDNITKSTSPVFDVSNTIPGAVIELLKDNVAVASVHALSFTSSITDPSPPADATVHYIVRQTIGGATSDPSSGLDVTFDHTPPTGTINQADSQQDPTNQSTLTYTAVFSERVNGLGALSFQGSTANVANASSSSSSLDGITFNVTVFGFSSNGKTVVANLQTGAFQDIAGNPGTALLSTDNTVTVDNVRPTVTINQASVQPDPTFSQPINFTVTFSEAVSGFDSSDFSFAGSTASGMSAAGITITGGPLVYNVAVSGVQSGGIVRLSIPSNKVADSFGNLNFASTSTDNSVTLRFQKNAFDFDGDGKTDISIFRPTGASGGAEWWYLRSSDGQAHASQFGTSTDQVVAADFTGDGKTDIAVWRPSTGQWFIVRSEDGSFYAFPFGAAGDIPMPADYDGDGKADAAVFRPSTATWFILRSSDGQVSFTGFGAPGDLPVSADYDGDGKADIGVFRPNGASGGAEWWIQRSTLGTLALQFGASTDKAVPGDYTGDGKTDIAFFRPSDGQWFVLRSEDFSYFAFPFGTAGDIPVPGDYDGDGKWDAAVFRPSASTWFVNRSSGGTTIQQFATPTDVPVANAYVR